MSELIGGVKLRYPVGDLEGMRVEVYRNLNNGKWSVRSLEGAYRGYVVAYVDEVVLHDALFYVSNSGRNKVLRNRVKMVHATVRGIFSYGKVTEVKDSDVSVYYDPYKVNYFVDRQSMEELHDTYSRIEFMNNKRVYIKK